MRKKQDTMWEQSTLWESVEKWVTKYLNADKHSPASSARSDCVHEQVAKRIANVCFTSYYTIFY